MDVTINKEPMKHIITSLALLALTLAAPAQQRTESKYFTTQEGRQTRHDCTYDTQGRLTDKTLLCKVDDRDDYMPVWRRLYCYDGAMKTMEYHTWNPWKRCFQPIERYVFHEDLDSAYVEYYRWETRKRQWKRQATYGYSL